LTASNWIQRLPLRISPRHAKEGEERRQHGPERRIQCDKLASDFLADSPCFVAILDVKVCPEEVNDGEIGGGLRGSTCTYPAAMWEVWTVMSTEPGRKLAA
jgi:hypothetical protein